MSTNPSKERSRDGSSQPRVNHIYITGPKVKKKTHPPKVTLPPLRLEPSCLSAPSVARSLFSDGSIFKNAPSDRSLPVLELPHIICQQGTGRATAEAKWKEGHRQMVSASHSLTGTTLCTQSLKEEDASLKVLKSKDKKTLKDRKGTKPNTFPFTGVEVFQMLALKRDPEDSELYFLKEVDSDAYRPYDLQVVDPKDAGSEHYLFSPLTVLHVTKTDSCEVIKLEQWYREYLLWTALQKIPFFRHFRLQKAFTWWHKIVRMISFQHKCKNLQHQLLIDVPQFRNALHLFTRVIEELKGTHLMPLDDSKTYTFLEFKNALMKKDQECLLSVEKLSQCHTVILNAVKEESYKTHHDLQLYKKVTKRPQGHGEPIHMFLAHKRELKKDLFHSESILKKLGNFTELIHQMIVQSLVTVIQQDATSFLSYLKRKSSQEGGLFHIELCFTASSQLTVEPPIHAFQETVSQSLLGAGNSIIQMCDFSGLFLEISNSVHSSAVGLTSDSSCISRENNNGMFGQSLEDNSAHQLVPAEESYLKVKGTMVHGCHYPLSKTQLEWHINIHNVTKDVENEQIKIMQEAELEIQQVCKSYAWLGDIHLFISQWSPSSLESLRGQPASVYEEQVTKLRSWVDGIYTLDSSISTSNQLFIIHCAHIKEFLGHQLNLIEQQVLEQMVEQTKLLSETFLSDMERAAAELKTEPQHLHDFSKYAFQVKESGKILPDLQKRLDYILSLQHSICMNYRKMTDHELALEQKVLGLWNSFNPLLKQAENLVCHSLPSMVDALDTMFSSFVRELKNLVLEATSGACVDPSQNASEMVSKLSYMCTHALTLSAKLEQVNQQSQILKGHTMDLAFLTTDVPKVTARKELWQLKADYTTWLEEWKKQYLSQDVVSEAQGKIFKWKKQIVSLTNIPADDPVVHEILGVLGSLSHQVEVMAKLLRNTLGEKHWKAIFKGIGLEYDPDKKVTVAEIIPQRLERQKLIKNICGDAQKEWNMKQTFQMLCLRWSERLFQLEKFTFTAQQHCETQCGITKNEKLIKDGYSNVPVARECFCNGERFIIIGPKTHLAEAENDLMTLSTMLKSQHSAEFRLQLMDWVWSLQQLGKLLYLFERYQEMWTFLTRMFGETSFGDQRVDLLNGFQPVDETFEKIVQSVSADPHVMNFVSSLISDTTIINDRFYGDNLCQILTGDLSIMEGIANQMLDILHTFCDQFPRLWFLSDREVMQLLSYHPTPFTLQPFVRKCFQGVYWLEVEVDCESSLETRNVKHCQASSENCQQMRVMGIFGSFQEHIAFQPPMEPNLDALVWLRVFEKQLKLTMMQLMKKCAVLQNQLEPFSHNVTCDKTARDIQLYNVDKEENIQPILNMISEYPLQCILVVEEAVWCSIVQWAFQEQSPIKLSKIETYISEKLQILGNTIRDRAKESGSKSVVSKYSMMCLRALVQLSMNHAQQLFRLMKIPCMLESSFEWKSMMKYHINTEDQILPGGADVTCYVDVLGHRFQYGFEYSGPEDWTMIHTPSTDQAILGIVLALSNHKCGFVSGPSMSGKTNTVIQLGKALGQHVVVKHCYPSMKLAVVQQMLVGALQTGAWLLLDCVDLLTNGVLSSLGQILQEIHQYFCISRKNKTQIPNEQPDDTTAGRATGGTNISDPECFTTLLGKKISAGPSYGCVLISTRTYTSVIPESLQFATRPIALTHPDCRIIAEVMLTSIGFLEAISLSHRLVSLISLAKDSKYIPVFLTDERSCFLGVLQKVISASEIHFLHAVGEKKIANETEVSRAGHSDCASLKHFCEKEKMESNIPSKLRCCQMSVIGALIEETAIVKALLSVLIPNNKKASQLYTIIKETFPIANQLPLSQQLIEEVENDQLLVAIKEELQQQHLYCDKEIISSAFMLYQTLKFSQAVILIGPSGSGKTTCFSALAGALNRLASKEVEDTFENEDMNKRYITEANSLILDMKWCSVDTLVLFPNAMSHEELFGSFCEKRGWKDGVVTKVLRDSELFSSNEGKSAEISKVKWLIMDGEPVGQLGWLDYLTTLFKSQDPALCQSPGEPLFPQSRLNLLMEMTDLRDASPSAVTNCSLVYFTSIDLWTSVWKSEIDAVSSEHKLDQVIKKIWHELADDLFSNTLSLLSQNALSCANSFEGGSSLQEVMSFSRILRALLEHYGNQLDKSKTNSQTHKGDVSLDGTNTSGTDSQSKREQLARNLFLVAYIWGFGGHLHSRHWPQFDLVVRQVLFSCRYKIVVPEEDSIFEHFFGIDSKICPKDTQLTNFIFPKYGTYRHLLNLMLVANQPVLLAGEPGSGKTTICKTLLSFDKSHISLPASPALSSRDLRIILNSIHREKNDKYSMGSMTKQPRLLLFVDDLHEAPRDVFGKISMALETLRQSISKGEIQTFDTYFIKASSSTAVSYFATCCISELSNPNINVISSRLSRLFSIFVLPSLSIDLILSIHSPFLKIWLKEMPLKHSDNLSNCIITATKDLYHTVCEQFQPSSLKPYLIFSQHDLQKVFSGMCLWQSNISNTRSLWKNDSSRPGSPLVPPGPPAALLNIVQLWMHECIRTFSDRLCLEEERKTLLSLIIRAAAKNFGSKLVNEMHPNSSDDPSTIRTDVVLTSPMDPICTSELIGQNLDTNYVLEELTPDGQLDNNKGHTLKKSFRPSEKNCSEDVNLKTHLMLPEIFQHLKNKVARLVYGPEFETLNSVNHQDSFRASCSYQEQDINVLLEELCVLRDRKEEDKRKKDNDVDNIMTKYIVHRTGVSQLLHILRALLMPKGHGVLIGSQRGTGRKTAVRLAAYLTGYQLIEVHSGNEDKLHTFLSEAGNQVTVDGVHAVILVHEEVSPSVREELLASMAQGAYPALYAEDELRNLVSRVSAGEYSRRYLMDCWMNKNRCISQSDRSLNMQRVCDAKGIITNVVAKYLRSAHDPFILRNGFLFSKLRDWRWLACRYMSRAHKNVHVFLLMPLIMPCGSEIPVKNEMESWSAQMTKAMKLSCCVEVYQPWSKQSLVESAVQCLYLHGMVQEISKDSLSVAMAGIHQSACQYASVCLGAQLFSPRTYLEFVVHFGHLFSKLDKQRQSKIKRVSTALAILDAQNNTVVECKEHTIRLQKMVAKTQQLEKDFLRAVEDHKEDSEKCLIEEKEIKPMFLLRLKILECLNPSDLEEVRHYRDPPEKVVQIMDVICFLFNHPPGWESAKQLLIQSNLLQELEFFDRHSLSAEQLQRLGQIAYSPQFAPESVGEASKACECLCRWVRAMYEYCSMQQAREAYQRLQDAKVQLQLIQNELEDQQLQLQKAESQEREAIARARQLEMFFRNWRAACEEAELCHQNVAGDSLILAGIISYLGPFGPDIRTELLNKWQELCRTGSININPKDLRSTLFTHIENDPVSPTTGFPIATTERLQLPLGQTLGMDEWQIENTLSSRLVVKLLLWGYRGAGVQRWPLLADTEQHLEINRLITGEDVELKNVMGFDVVICANDMELLEKLDHAAEKGWKVLLTHVECAKPSLEFLAKLARPVECCFSGLQPHSQLVHPGFCLFLTTDLPVTSLTSEIHASILTEVDVIDLSLSTKEIQELLLTQLLQSECGDVLSQRLRFQNYNQSLREKLVTEEDALMDCVLHSGILLLKDSDFPLRVAVCQEEMKRLQAEIKQLSKEQEYHESLLAAPRKLMNLAAALYQALQVVSCLSPAYYFSLCDFITVMQDSFSEMVTHLVPYMLGKADESMLPEMMNMMVLQVLVQYRPRLFKSHAAVLELLLSLALLKYNPLCSESDSLAFVSGLEDMEHPVTEVKPCSFSGTVPQPHSNLPSNPRRRIHSEPPCLETIPSFRGLIASLCTSPIQWQEDLHFPYSTVVGGHSHFPLLQWKSILPNCLEGRGKAIEACLPCLSGKTEWTESPHTGNPEALSKYLVKFAGPIILTLPNPERDMHISIQPLHLINQLGRCVGEKHQIHVKIISSAVLRDRKLILSVLDKAVNDGHWLVFNSCHLLDHWDHKVVDRLSQLISFKEGQYLIHPCFRLWFVTQENASHSVPAAVRMCALRLVCDSPWDLKEELTSSLRQVVLFSQTESWSDVIAGNMDLLLCCALFHSVLLQRQIYKFLGHGRGYRWSQEDLLALVDVYISIVSRCHDKTHVLQHLAVTLVHGGHVLDSTDLEVMESVAKCCFTAELTLSEDVSHILSNIIRNCDPLDLSGLLQDLDQYFQDTTISDPVKLGFSVDAASEITEIKRQNLNVVVQASQISPGTVGGFITTQNQPVSLPAYSDVRDRLRALKNYLAQKKDGAVTNVGAVSCSPLHEFFQAEWDDLFDSVCSLLSEFQNPVQHRLSSASLLSFTELSHLEKKAELLSAYVWQDHISNPPVAYQLSAFKNARAFFVALMREAAQVNHRYISDIILHFQVMCRTTYPAWLSPDTVYLCGLELRGASWDTELGALQDTSSAQRFLMPLVCVKAQVRGACIATDTLSCKSSYLMDTSNVTAGVSPLTTPQLPVYYCPLYLDEEHQSGNWELPDINAVTKIPLHTKLNPVSCYLRRVRLVSTL